MLDKLRKRLRSEKGFTLIELLVVMIILAILTAIAIPSYLSFRDRANKSAAGADLRAVIPSVEACFSDNGTYAGMTIAGTAGVLRPVDQPEHHPRSSQPERHDLLRPGDLAERRDEDVGQEGRPVLHRSSSETDHGCACSPVSMPHRERDSQGGRRGRRAPLSRLAQGRRLQLPTMTL